MRGRLTRKEFMQAAGVAAGALVSGGLLDAVPALPALALDGDDHGAPGPIRPVRLSPFPGGRRVCADTQLSITFSQPPLVGTSGTIRVVAADGTVVDTIDLSLPAQSRMIGTAPLPFNYHPVTVSGSTATIWLHQQLAYGQTHHVLVDPGVFTDAQGRLFAGITNPFLWRFTTKPAAPRAGSTRLFVAAGGFADFCTVQGAIDLVPDGNTQPVEVIVLPGTYTEIVYVGPTKTFVTVRGLDRARTVIRYANNNTLNPVNNLYRGLFVVAASDFTIEELTLHNTTPEGGSQAEAFRGTGQRVLLNRLNLLSRQDTIRLQGAGFVVNTHIEGDVDFTWGTGGAFFSDCEVRSLHRTVASSADVLAQIRNTQTTHGNVYLRCRLTGPDLQASDTAFLARIDPGQFPFSQVIYIDCAMDSHIPAAGWRLDNATAAPNVQFWEHRSTDLQGVPLDVSGRAPFSRQLSDAEAAQWSDPTFVLGWTPPVPHRPHAPR
jgi:Pectinesterase/Bacterial Ig-like domain